VHHPVFHALLLTHQTPAGVVCTSMMAHSC
jgi:hypothetical protein